MADGEDEGPEPRVDEGYSVETVGGTELIGRERFVDYLRGRPVLRARG